MYLVYILEVTFNKYDLTFDNIINLINITLQFKFLKYLIDIFILLKVYDFSNESFYPFVPETTKINFLRLSKGLISLLYFYLMLIISLLVKRKNSRYVLFYLRFYTIPVYIPASAL